MNPLVSLLVIFSITAAPGLCENKKRGVYVENSGVNPGVVFSSGLSSHDSFGHVDVASGQHGLALAPAGYGVVGSAYRQSYAPGLSYGPSYGYGNYYGSQNGIYGHGGLQHNGPSVVHTSGAVVSGVNVAQGTNYEASNGRLVSNQVLVANGIAQHRPIYTSQLPQAVAVSGPQAVHVAVNQNHPVNVYHPSINVPMISGTQQQVQHVVVPHQAGGPHGSFQQLTSGQIVSSAAVSTSALPLDHPHGSILPGQTPVYYTGQNGYSSSGWTSQGQLHTATGPQVWVQ